MLFLAALAAVEAAGKQWVCLEFAEQDMFLVSFSFSSAGQGDVVTTTSV